MARTDASGFSELTFSPDPRRAPTSGSVSSVSSTPKNPLGCTTTPRVNKNPSQTKHPMKQTPQTVLPEPPRGLRGYTRRHNRKTSPADNTENPPAGSARTARGLGGYTRGCARTHPPNNRRTSPTDNAGNPQPVLPEPPWGTGATPTGALARTHRQDKNPPDDSAQIAQGLEGSCRVYKPGVPRGPTSTPGLGLGGRPFFLLDRPKSLNSTDRSTRFRPRPPSAHLSDRSTSSGSGQLRTASPIGVLALGSGCLRTASTRKA